MTSSVARLRALERQVFRPVAPAITVPSDPVAFAESLGIEPDAWQAAALHSQARRQVWLACRQSGKSLTAAVAALHTALVVPDALVLLVSPSQRQSGLLYRSFRELAARLPVPVGMVEDTRTSATFANKSRVVSLPGTANTIRGFSAPDLVIEDEAAFVADETHHAVRPMLATSDGRLLLLSTPFGKKGHLWDLWSNGTDWERIRITADDVPRIPDDFLAAERATLPDFVYRSEYQCEFVENEFSVFRHDDIDRALSSTVTPLFGGIAA